MNEAKARLFNALSYPWVVEGFIALIDICIMETPEEEERAYKRGALVVFSKNPKSTYWDIFGKSVSVLLSLKPYKRVRAAEERLATERKRGCEANLATWKILEVFNPRLDTVVG